jgi:hypothetical protein
VQRAHLQLSRVLSMRMFAATAPQGDAAPPCSMPQSRAPACMCCVCVAVSQLLCCSAFNDSENGLVPRLRLGPFLSNLLSDGVYM